MCNKVTCVGIVSSVCVCVFLCTSVVWCEEEGHSSADHRPVWQAAHPHVGCPRNEHRELCSCIAGSVLRYFPPTEDSTAVTWSFDNVSPGQVGDPHPRTFWVFF